MIRRVTVYGLLLLAGALALVAQTNDPKAQPRRPGHVQTQQAERLLDQVLNPRLPARMGAIIDEDQSQHGLVFDATRVGSPVVLDEGWRVGITSDPAAAQADFDDSSWAVRSATASFEDVAAPPAPTDQDHSGQRPANANGVHRRPAVWFRMHIKLAPQHGPLSLLIVLPSSETSSLNTVNTMVDLFANGKRVQPDGPNGDTPERFQQISRIYDLNVDEGVTTLVVAIRTPYIPVGFSSYTNFFAARKLVLGYRPELNRALENWQHRNLFERLPRLVDSTILLVMACFMLALYFRQRGHNEYLWLALYQLAQVPIGFVDLASSSAWLDHLWDVALKVQLWGFSAYFYFEFLVAFLEKPRRWTIRSLRWTAPLLLCIAPCLLITGHNAFVAILLNALLIVAAVWVVSWFVFIFWTLIAATLKRNFEAGLLLLPLVLSLIGWIEPVVAAGLNDFGSRTASSPLTIQAGPIPFHFSSVADFTGILVIVLIIFVRFLRIQRDQERAQNELAAARGVQEVLIPREKPVTPGYEVESVFRPATEVGGDFFHVEPLAEGGLLVVLGDVAGKGLKAAMNVSILIGALRSSHEQSPAGILKVLNHVLVGSEGFTTCLAAWFGPYGELTISSAGHLSPYLNSQEITLPPALPLGILPQADYEETQLYLHPGDRLLILSDGVVEARRPSGELFGFDRLHNLSNQSAFYLADAAMEFGQQDDITVLTVRREVGDVRKSN